MDKSKKTEKEKIIIISNPGVQIALGVGVIIILIMIGVRILGMMKETIYDYEFNCLINCSTESRNYINAQSTCLKNCTMKDAIDSTCNAFPECGCCNITLRGGI